MVSPSKEREHYTYHPTKPMTYHLSKVPWTLFGSLTFRVVPPEYVQKRCIMEFTRRVLKKFNTDSDLNWGSRWVFRQEFGEKNGRCHWHFLMVLDKPQPNMKSFCYQIKNIWEQDVASRQINRYNKAKEKHNADLRKELRYKPSEVREAEYEARCRPHIRNDYSSPGYADVRQFNPELAGVDYIMKGEDWNYNSANSYELAKFNERDDTKLIASHRLLMGLFLKVNGKTTRKDKMLFQKGLLQQTNPSRIGPQDTYRRTPNTSRQLFDPQPEFVDATEVWSEAGY